MQQIPDRFIHMSLGLQALFGLRREESIKIIPAWADRGDRLVLKDSWTKGGREREIPIRTPEQRRLLDEAKALAKGKSLVAPGYTTYATISSIFVTNASESAFTPSTAIGISTRRRATRN